MHIRNYMEEYYREYVGPYSSSIIYVTGYKRFERWGIKNKAIFYINIIFICYFQLLYSTRSLYVDFYDH